MRSRPAFAGSVFSARRMLSTPLNRRSNLALARRSAPSVGATPAANSAFSFATTGAPTSTSGSGDASDSHSTGASTGVPACDPQALALVERDFIAKDSPVSDAELAPCSEDRWYFAAPSESTLEIKLRRKSGGVVSAAVAYPDEPLADVWTAALLPPIVSDADATSAIFPVPRSGEFAIHLRSDAPDLFAVDLSSARLRTAAVARNRTRHPLRRKCRTVLQALRVASGSGGRGAVRCSDGGSRRIAPNAGPSVRGWIDTAPMPVACVSRDRLLRPGPRMPYVGSSRLTGLAHEILQDFLAGADAGHGTDRLRSDRIDV